MVLIQWWVSIISSLPAEQSSGMAIWKTSGLALALSASTMFLVIFVALWIACPSPVILNDSGLQLRGTMFRRIGTCDSDCASLCSALFFLDGAESCKPSSIGLKHHHPTALGAPVRALLVIRITAVRTPGFSHIAVPGRTMIDRRRIPASPQPFPYGRT